MGFAAIVFQVRVGVGLGRENPENHTDRPIVQGVRWKGEEVNIRRTGWVLFVQCRSEKKLLQNSKPAEAGRETLG